MLSKIFKYLYYYHLEQLHVTAIIFSSELFHVPRGCLWFHHQLYRPFNLEISVS